MTKDYILGIHDGHCATACILEDGKIIAGASEERFVGIKNESGLPRNAIEYCLREARISPQQLGKIVLSTEFMAPLPGRMYPIGKEKKDFFYYSYKLAQIFRKRLYKTPKIHNFFYENFQLPHFSKKSIQVRFKELSEFLQVDKNKLLIQDHHECHAYTALYGSDFPRKKKNALVLTLDGEGDGICATVNVFRNGKLERIAETSHAFSIPLLYLEVTKYLGMKPLEHEHKVMGLAPYAYKIDVEKCREALEDIVKLESIRFKGKYHSHNYRNIIQDRLKYKRFDCIAGAIQKVSEDLVTDWVSNCIKETGIRNLALAGGIFMNVKVNMKIANIDKIDELFIFPSCGDESLSFGACYYGYERLCEETNKKCVIDPLKHLYLGPVFTDNEVERAFNGNKIEEKYRIEKIEDIEEKIAHLLSQGEIVARCSGRMEWGARALGNRSILADASRQDVVREINKAIKSRDFWMPFAPTILKEEEKEYIINPKSIQAPYMIFAFDSTERAKKELVAAIHPYDFTIRPQVIEKDWNESYYRIIQLFKEKTGRGGILNTSFNLHGYPIVLGPNEALSVFENSGLKYLVLNNYLVCKKFKII